MGLNEHNKASESSGITLTNNEITDIIKPIESLENRGLLLTETTEKVTNQKERFLGLLMRVGLALMKCVLTPIAKNVLLPLRVTAGI